MIDLYLERIGLARPTIVKRDNDGEIERLGYFELLQSGP